MNLRKYIRSALSENVEQHMVADLVRLLTQKFEHEYGVSCDLINQGDCSNFAEELQEILKEIGINSEILSDGLFYDPFDDTEDDMMWDASEYGDVPINFKEVGLPSHYWVYVNGKHYDSDAPEGVFDMFHLPIIKNFYKKEKNKLKENTSFVDGVPYGYNFDTSVFPSKIFEDKSGEKYIIFVHENGGSSREYYTIVVKTLGEQVDRKDRYGRTGSYLGGDMVGTLWLEECEDGTYRSTPTLSDGLWVREDKRRQGIATAMHDYANKVLGLKTDISTVASGEAQSFWKNRKSKISEEEIKLPNIPNTMNFWHGGNLDDYNDLIAQKNGRYEYGPGLYLITKYDVAAKYAKGSRKLYIVTVEKGVDINDALIDADMAKKFIDTYVISHHRKQIWERISNPKFVVDGKIRAYVFNNIILNEKAIKSTNTKFLRAFYVDNGIDYEIVDNPFGWGEKMLVLYNMKKIVNTTQVKPGDKISDYAMLDKQQNISEVVAGEDEENTEMISGIIDLLCQVKDMNNRKKMVIDQINGLKGEGIDIDEKEFARRCGFSEDILQINENNKKNTITVYHGTSLKKASGIKQNGLTSASMGYSNASWYMVSTDYASALFHATAMESGDDVVVFEFNVPIENKRWEGDPYFWPPYERNDNSKWFALKQPLSPNFISDVKLVSYDEFINQKNKGM